MYELKIGGVSVGITKDNNEVNRWMHAKESCFDKELYEFQGSGKKLVAVIRKAKVGAEWSNRPRVKM